MKNTFTSPRAALVGALSLTALSLVFSAPAEAINWNWTYTQTNPGTINAGNGSGTFTSTDAPPGGPFTITAITGSFANLGSITSLIGSGGFGGNNNLILNSGQLTTGTGGVSFVAGGTNYKLSNPSGTIYLLQPTSGGSIGTFSATQQATPVPLESDALPILGSVAFMAGGLWWKRKRAQAKVSEFVANKG